jgi:hypothetical protein
MAITLGPIPTGPVHPNYLTLIDELQLYRYTMEGGKEYINLYLEKYSDFETAQDYTARKNLTYNPACAKTAVKEVIQSIFNRLVDVSREGGGQNYSIAMEKNVDNRLSSMTNFMGQTVLPELLTAGRVGVFIDKPKSVGNTYAESKTVSPYLYIYKSEQIINWNYSIDNVLERIKLEECYFKTDEEGFPSVTSTRTKTLILEGVGTDARVKVVVQDEEPYYLSLPRIPFVILDIGESLLKDVAGHQIALLNMASTDVFYAHKANFPFYTEQYSAVSDIQGKVVQKLTAGDGTAAPGTSTDSTQHAVGITRGRRYGKDLERPGFISPSTDPLLASMAKQEKIEDQIRVLLHLAVSNVPSKSADSKGLDRQGLEAGLANIAQELRRGEQYIAEVWANYQSDPAATVTYPINYSIQTDAERREEANDLIAILPKIPSKTYQQAVCMRIANLIVGNQVSNNSYEKIAEEILSAEIIVTDPEILRLDLEAGLVDTETASQARGYPKGSVEKAKKDHADRLARVAIAQTKGMGASAARGVDTSDHTDAREEKVHSQSADTNPDAGSKRVRGEEE